MHAKRSTVPPSIEEITPAWLAIVLEAKGGPPSIDSMEVQRSGGGYGLSSEVYRITLNGSGVPDSTVVKLWRTDPMAGSREDPPNLRSVDRQTQQQRVPRPWPRRPARAEPERLGRQHDAVERRVVRQRQRRRELRARHRAQREAGR